MRLILKAKTRLVKGADRLLFISKAIGNQVIKRVTKS
jgi:hypothetical protein